MRMICGAVFGMISLLSLAAMFPPAGNAYGVKGVEPTALPRIAKVEQSVLPTAPTLVSVTLEEPQPFDPRTMTIADLKERRASALAAQQQAREKDHQM